MRTATPAGVTTCSLCGNQSVHLRKVKVLDLHDKEVEITVGRCVICDTRPCPHCQGYNLDPKATKCRHCDGDIALSVPDPD